MSNATDRNSVRISYTNSNLSGYMPNSSQQKNVFNAALTTTSPNKKLEFFSNVTYLNTATTGRPETGYGDNNVMVKFVQWGHRELDMAQAKDLWKYPDGTQVTWNRKAWDDPTPAYSNNPYWSRYMNYENDTRNRLYGNAGLSIPFTSYLKFKYTANLDFWVDKQYERRAVYSQEESFYKEMSRQQYELNHEFLLSFNKTISDFSLGANLGSNLMHRTYEYVYGESVGGLVLPEFYSLSNSTGLARAYNKRTEKSINSLFASATVGFKNTVFLDASLRNDWSSTLPAENNSYLYPSITGSLVFSELLEQLSWFSFGKARIGYAQVGSDTDPYLLSDIYSFNNSITSTPGYILSNTQRNPNLRPEATNSFEVGLEASFFGSRLGFEFSYYSSKTTDQIIPLTVSGTTGYSYTYINGGAITNKGIEARVYGTPVKVGDFAWETSLALASNTTRVAELLDGVDYYRIINAPFKVEIGAMKGQEFMIMGTDYKYDDNGNKIIRANGTYDYTDGNVALGKIYPDFTGGWMNTFRYKGFDLGVLFDFSKGGHYFSTSYMWGMYSGMLDETVATNENGKNIRDAVDDGGGVLLQGVLADGTPNTRRISGRTYGSQFYSGPAAQSVLKSDFIKLREINFGYTFPLKKEWLVKSLRVALYGRNLAVWGPDVKHFDPEMAITNSGNTQGIEGGAMVGVANYGFNLTLKF
jgi:hypothetical protein